MVNVRPVESCYIVQPRTPIFILNALTSLSIISFSKVSQGLWNVDQFCWLIRLQRDWYHVILSYFYVHRILLFLTFHSDFSWFGRVVVVVVAVCYHNLWQKISDNSDVVDNDCMWASNRFVSRKSCRHIVWRHRVTPAIPTSTNQRTRSSLLYIYKSAHIIFILPFSSHVRKKAVAVKDFNGFSHLVEATSTVAYHQQCFDDFLADSTLIKWWLLLDQKLSNGGC